MVWQRAGTVSVQNGSTTVTGAGVDFAASSRVGDSFIGPDGATYEVANVASSTVISILPAYKGPTVTGAAYAIMPVQGYDKMLSDAFSAMNNQFGPKLAALGTTGNYDVLPQNKGGTGVADGRPKLTSISLSGVLSGVSLAQGAYMGWNTGGASGFSGEFNFLCNNGGGTGGFTWRSINADNSASGPEMTYSYGGLLTVPSLAIGTALPIASGGTGATSQATARTSLGLGTVAIENIVPQTKGGTARTDGRISVIECFVASAGGLYASQGLSIGWNNIGTGEANFICNQGDGTGGFRWRTVNSTNTASGPEMIYSYAGSLSVPTSVTPSSDSGATLGTSSLRWNTVYATTGAINTSDAREKTIITPLTSGELKAAKMMGGEIGSYQFLSAIEEKGDSARRHVGMTVQRAIEIMIECGLDPMRYAFICYDKWEEIPEVRGSVEVGNILFTKYTDSPEANKEEVMIASGVRYSDYVSSYGNDPAYRWDEISNTTVVTQEFKSAGDRYGFRYDQLAMFIARGQEERISRLEALTSATA